MVKSFLTINQLIVKIRSPTKNLNSVVGLISASKQQIVWLGSNFLGPQKTAVLIDLCCSNFLIHIYPKRLIHIFANKLVLFSVVHIVTHHNCTLLYCHIAFDYCCVC